MYISSIPDKTVFDFIIVGAGTAGCVLADRLSADGQYQVLLLEAGGKDANINIRIPLMVTNVLRDERYIWPYVTESQPHINGRTHLVMRGKVIGGSGSINGNLFVRGEPRAYDSWRDEMGCAGWGYSDLLPIFKRLEDFPEGDPALRGRGGPINCTRLDKFDPLSDAFLDACDEAGFKRIEDYNDGTYEGAGYLQYSTRKGLRSSTAGEYLRRALKRPNLSVLTGAVATHIVMEGKRAAGVTFRIGGETCEARAQRETILAAGPIASPQLLELSGIGNGEILRHYGIEVAHHLPGIGENLRDHPNTRLTFQCSQPITINDVLMSPWLKFREALKFAFKRQGLLTICVSTAQTILRSRPDAAHPDLVLRMAPLSGKDRYARTPKLGLDPFPGFTLGVSLLYPRSVGSLHIQSRDPLQHPLMNPRFFSDEADALLLLQGMRIARQVSQFPALKPLVVRETRPGPEVEDDAAMLEYLRATVSTSWHQIGTCKMGIDASAVVDPQLRIHGLEGLRVIDSSICPTLPASNTNIPTIAIAEKGSDLLLESARA